MLATFVMTVELGSTVTSTSNALELALEETGARLVAPEWVPDNDTVRDAYGAHDMPVVLLAP